MCLDTPVAKANQFLAILVSISGGHAVGLLTVELACQSIRRTVGQPKKAAFVGETFQPRLRIGKTDGVQSFGGSMCVKCREVIGERRCLMIGREVFSGGNDFAFDQFRPAFQFPEHRTGSIFIAAAGRKFADNALSVAKLGRERRGFGLNPQRAIFAGRHFGRSRLAFRGLPSRKPLSASCEQFGPTGSSRVRVLRKTVPIFYALWSFFAAF